MNFDAFSVAAMAAEMRPLLLGGRVQQVTQINSLTYGLEIFRHPTRYYLLISAEPQAPRFHLTPDKTRRGTGSDTPLMLSLRKYLRGARLLAIEQPPYERIIHLRFENYVSPTLLIAEMLGTHSNLILTEATPTLTLLGAARLSKQGDARRLLLPGERYEPPPPQVDKLAPDEITSTILRRELAEASPEFPLVRLLPGVIQGVSPLLAREVVFRATGSTKSTAGQVADVAPLEAACRELFAHLQHGEWQPTLAVDDAGDPLAFAPYPLRHLPHTEPATSFSAAVEAYFADAAGGYAAAKVPLLAAIAEARRKLARRRERLATDAAERQNPAQLKIKGETILACAHQIKPGQKELVVDWGEPLTISLDPTLSASDNAQHYFHRYRKAQRAGDEIPAQLAKIGLEEDYLAQLEQDLAMAENRPDVDAVGEALAAAGYSVSGQKRRAKSVAARPLRLTAPDGATVWVGKNATQNARLTFTPEGTGKRAAGDDLWLHARGVPGAHVIIPTAEGLPSEEDVVWAAGVAAYYSRARHDTSVEVDVTLKKYVRAIKGAAPGLVTYRQESTLRVAPIAPDS